MDLEFTARDQAFCREVRDFLEANLTDSLKSSAKATTGVFAEPAVGQDWQRILYKHGWLAYNWPADNGGTGWTPIQRYIFEKESAIAGAPALPALGLKLLGPIICAFGTGDQKAYFLPKILNGDH